MNHDRPRWTHQAFTLVECVLALAVMTTGVLLIIALLPHGLEQTRAAALKSAEAQVMHHVQAVIRQGGPGGVQYFDRFGLPQEKWNAESVFVVEWLPATAVRIPGDVPLGLPRYRVRLSSRAAESADALRLPGLIREQYLLSGGPDA